LTWAGRLASPDEAARYDRELITASSNQATEKWVTGMLALMPSELLFAELTAGEYCQDKRYDPKRLFRHRHHLWLENNLRHVLGSMR
jgi:hypothetical protein